MESEKTGFMYRVTHNRKNSKNDIQLLKPHILNTEFGFLPCIWFLNYKPSDSEK